MQYLDDLRKKLEALNRGAVKPRAPRGADAERTGAPRRPIVYSRDLPSIISPPPQIPLRRRRTGPVVLEETVPGSEMRSAHGGKAYLVDAYPDDLDESLRGVCEEFLQTVARPDSPVLQALAALCKRPSLKPQDVVFLDLETTGLSHSPLFLIGTVTWESGEARVRQYLARTYAEEKPAISLFLNDLAARKVLISFNGKSYDWPFMRTRATYHRLPLAVEPGHLDLLHLARRAWRGSLPDCRLSTLEKFVCHRRRFDDIPSSEIPDAYRAFVRTRDASELIEILKHNRLDLITMAELLLRIPHERLQPRSS